MKKHARNKLKKEILATLERYAPARDNDLVLMLYIWRDFYPSRTFRDAAGKAYYYALDIKDSLPREDHIKRIRAKIQNEEKKWLPTSWIVAKKRRIAEIDWREYVAKQGQPEQQSFPQVASKKA